LLRSRAFRAASTTHSGTQNGSIIPVYQFDSVKPYNEEPRQEATFTPPIVIKSEALQIPTVEIKTTWCTHSSITMDEFAAKRALLVLSGKN
jgi:hypothetical protein